MGGVHVLADHKSDLQGLRDLHNRRVKGDIGTPGFGRQMLWTQFDGSIPSVNGSVATTDNRTLVIRSTATGGKHRATLLSATAATATPTAANAIELVDDAFLAVGAGKQLRLYDAAGVDYAALSADADGGLVLGGSGANSGLLVGDWSVTGNLKWKSGTAFLVTLDHAATAARTITVPDATDTLALLGLTQTFTGQNTFNNATAPIIAAKLGPSSTQQHTLPAVASDTLALLAATQDVSGKTFTDNLVWKSGTSFKVTLDHTASADRVVTVQNLDGTMALLGAQNAGHLLFVDNTYDIGASGATRPRHFYLSGDASIGGIATIGSTLTVNGEASAKTIQTAQCNAPLTLTTSFQDVSNCSVSLTPGEWVVTGVFDFNIIGTDTAVDMQGQLVPSGGTASISGTAVARLRTPTATFIATVSQTWRVSVTATTTAKLQAKKTGGTGTSVATTNGQIVAAFVGKP